MHGYMIAKIIGRVTGPFRMVQWGTLYPILSRLEHDGYITAEECDTPEDSRSRKVYAITPAGRRLLHERLMDTEMSPADYASVFAHKVAFFHLLEPRERVRLARHYAVYAQQHIDHLQRTLRELQDPVIELEQTQRNEIEEVLQHQVDRWTLELGWAERLINAHNLAEVS
jgi:DNA-binding PadR family transcriptional regulator